MAPLKRIVIVAVSLYCAGCSDNQDSSASPNSQANAVAQAQGYVATASPANDRVALLIEIGKIRANLDAYHTSASLYTSDTTEAQQNEWRRMLTKSVNQSTVDAYQAIEPLITASQGAEIMPRLTRLISPESVTRASDNNRDNRDAKRIEYEMARGTQDRLKAVSDDIYPTRKEYFLVASALLRMGGDHAAKAIDDNGVVIDLYQLLMAAAYNWIADNSHPRWVSYCAGQREPLQKLDEGLQNISAKAAANKKGMQLQVTARDFYQLASTAQSIAAGLPDNDKQICA